MTHDSPDPRHQNPDPMPNPNMNQNSGSSSSLLRNALLCVIVAAIAALAYAINVESSLFRAVALQLSLCATAIWAAMDAAKIRRRVSHADTDDEAKLAQKREASAIHYLFLAAPVVAVIVFAAISILVQMVEVAPPKTQQHIIGGAILAVLAASLWTVFARALEQYVPSSDNAESEVFHEAIAVRAAFSEARLAALVTAGTLMVATVHPPFEGWLAWGLSVWVIAVSLENLFRLFVCWFQPVSLEQPFVAPIDSLLRDIFLSSTNPVARAFDIAEARFGLSLRSSWTIGFFRRSVFPIAIGCLLVVWLSTCFVVIEPHQAGLEERFGVIQRVALQPGLHTKLPWPIGSIRRFPAGVVHTMQIGFEEETQANVSEDVDRTLLWTQAHAEEFSLVLGSETELVAVNAIVYFKISEDPEGFLDHALATSNPEVALKALAYRVMMEQTRSVTLAQLLSLGRDQFADSVRKKLTQYVRQEKLGFDIVDVALINLHPPVEVANSYLDVINAELDSNQAVTVAKGDAAKLTLEAVQGSNGRIADAKVDAAKRVSLAGQESSEFMAVGKAYTQAPETYRLRLWFEAIERVLSGRRLFVVDSELPDVIFDERASSIDSTLINSAQPSNRK